MSSRQESFRRSAERTVVAVATVLAAFAQVISSQPCVHGASPIFEVKTLGQNNPEPGALNTITMSLKASVKLPASSSIVISGLRGAAQVLHQGSVPGVMWLGGAYRGRPELFCAFPMSSEQKPQWLQSSNGAWDEQGHVLTLYVCPGAEIACEEVRFSITVQNPALPQAAPEISIEARDASGGSIVPKMSMSRPQGRMILSGVPLGLQALHVEAATIPERVVLLSPAGGHGLASLAASLSGVVEIWLRPGWYQETNCNAFWTQNFTMRGMSSSSEDTVVDCKGVHRHMEIRGASGAGRISNVMMANGFAQGDGGCILVQGGSLHLQDVSFENCRAAGPALQGPGPSGPGSSQWRVGSGFGGAVAVISSECVDNMEWRDSEGLGCESYNPFPKSLIRPNFDDPSQDEAARRCTSAAQYANKGSDARSECCFCKYLSELSEGVCQDDNIGVSTDSGGAFKDCSELAFFCADDSGLVAQYGAPEGWLHERCPKTCGLCADSQTECMDSDAQVKSDTSGAIPDCASASGFCADDSMLVAQGAPEGWLHERCPKTCGLCADSSTRPQPSTTPAPTPAFNASNTTLRSSNTVAVGATFSRRRMGHFESSAVFSRIAQRRSGNAQKSEQKCLVSSADGLSHSETTCPHASDACVTATSSVAQIYQCSSHAAALGIDCSASGGTLTIQGIEFSFTCCSGMMCNSQQSTQTECMDSDAQVKSDTSGAIPDCASASGFCADDSVLVAQGVPEGWLHERCPKTCGLCADPPQSNSTSGRVLYMQRVKISSCTASMGGGGVAVWSEGPDTRDHRSIARISLSHTLISNCSASLGGGGILVLSTVNGTIGSVHVVDTAVSNCVAAADPRSDVVAFGGGIGIFSLWDGTVAGIDLSGIRVDNCNATTGAGGVIIWADKAAKVGDVTMSECRIQSCNGLSAGGLVVGSRRQGEITASVTLQGVIVADSHALDTPWFLGEFEPAIFQGMEANALFPHAGGIYLSADALGDIRLFNTKIMRCTALSIDGWGGGIFIGHLTHWIPSRVIVDGIVVEDCASWLGGALFLFNVGHAQPASVVNAVLRNNNASLAGGLAVWLCDFTIGPNVTIVGNTVICGGGGIAMYGSSVKMGASSNDLRVVIRDNRALGDLDISRSDWIKKIPQILASKSTRVFFAGQGGGILVLSTTDLNNPGLHWKAHLKILGGVSIMDNVAGNGGGVALATAMPVYEHSPKSVMIASGDVLIAGNTAVRDEFRMNHKVVLSSFKIAGGEAGVPFGDGGGVWALDSSTVSLMDGVVVRGNHAENTGGGACVHLSASMVMNGAMFVGNNAVGDGGAVSVLLGVVGFHRASSVVAQRAKFSHNTAGGSGGAIATDFDSAVTLQDCVLEQNSASSGGGLASMVDSSISLMACHVSSNQARKDGGGVLAAGFSTVKVMGGSIDGNLVKTDGGGVVAIDSASMTFSGAQRIIVRNNTAVKDGGGMLFSTDGKVRLESKMIYMTENSATRGGAICFVSKVELLPGAATTIESNRASEMGGGLFGYGPNADMVISDQHFLNVSSNIAGTNGGGIALSSLAKMGIVPTTSCPCKPSSLGDGVCNLDCMLLECNWDMGDCHNIFLEAGKSASLKCDRSVCSHVEEQMESCFSPCMTAQCDWSKSFCQSQKALLGKCPLFDAVVLESLETWATGVKYVEEGSVNSYGRCTEHSCSDSAVSTVPYDDYAKVTFHVAEKACESKGTTLIMSNFDRIKTIGWTWVGAKGTTNNMGGTFAFLNGSELSVEDPAWLPDEMAIEAGLPDGSAVCVAYWRDPGPAHPGSINANGLWAGRCSHDQYESWKNDIQCEDGQVVDAATLERPEGKKCVVIDDDGQLAGALATPGKPQRAAWGYCTSKKRLPSSGFDHSEDILKDVLRKNISTLLRLFPGCGGRPLEVAKNIAGSWGGGMYLSDCDKSAERSGICPLLNSHAKRLSAMQVNFNGNHAGLAGGGIFINCPKISTICDAVIRAKINLPKIQGRIIVVDGNSADGYGREIAQAPARLSTKNVLHEYAPGRDKSILRLSVAVFDEHGALVRGSETIANPYQVSLEICPPEWISGTSSSPVLAPRREVCNAKEQLQPKMTFRLEATKGWTNVDPFGFSLKRCLVGMSHMSVHLSLDDESSSDVGALHSSFLVLCLPCGPGEMYTESKDELGRLLWRCQQCDASQYTHQDVTLGAAQYITDSNAVDVRCQRCPIGAVCNGKVIRGKVNGSEWVRNGSHVRLQSCPKGYILVRNEDRPETDECVLCPRGKYSTQPSFYPREGTPGARYVTDSSLALSFCIECNWIKSTCAGGSDVAPKAGFWDPAAHMNSTNSRRQTTESLNESLQVELIACNPAERCLRGGVCAAGMHGPVCGVCKDGFAMGSKDLCIACPKSKRLTMQIVGVTVLVGLFCVAYYFILLQPLLRADDDQVDKPQSISPLWHYLGRKISVIAEIMRLEAFMELSVMKVVARFFSAVFERIHDFMVFCAASFLKNNGSEMVKVIISFMQVSGSFLSGYPIKWPGDLENFLRFALAFTVRLRSLPGNLACAMVGMTFYQLQLCYLIAPLVLIALLSLPAIYVKICGRTHPQYGQVIKTFTSTFTFVLFLLYPILSSPALDVFHCVDVGGGKRRLKGDLELACPANHPSSRAFILGIILVLLYPVGILLLFLSLILYYQVPQMAKAKIEDAYAHSLIAFYKKSQAKTLVAKIAMEVGGSASLSAIDFTNELASPDSVADAHNQHPDTNQAVAESQFKARIKLLFDSATNDGNIQLDAARLRHYLHQLGISGAQETQLDQLFNAYDDDGNGTLDFLEFQAMIREITEHVHLFSGTERLHDLTIAQLRTLVTFNWEQVTTKFDDETGLMLTVKKFVLEKENQIAKKRNLKSLKKAETVNSSQSVSTVSASFFQRTSSDRSGPTCVRLASLHTSQGETYEAPDTATAPLFLPPPIDLDDVHAMRGWVVSKGTEMVDHGSIALPTVGWDGSTASEKHALDRISFIFSAYKVQFFYYELLEMIRKLLMVGCMGLVMPGLPQQFAIGLLITVSFLVLSLRLQPWAHPSLNTLNLFSLSFQTIILFTGLVKSIAEVTVDTARISDKAVTQKLIVALTVMVAIVPAAILCVENKINPFKSFLNRCGCQHCGTASTSPHLSNNQEDGGSAPATTDANHAENADMLPQMTAEPAELPARPRAIDSHFSHVSQVEQLASFSPSRERHISQGLGQRAIDWSTSPAPSILPAITSESETVDGGRFFSLTSDMIPVRVRDDIEKAKTRLASDMISAIDSPALSAQSFDIHGSAGDHRHDQLEKGGSRSSRQLKRGTGAAVRANGAVDPRLLAGAAERSVTCAASDIQLATPLMHSPLSSPLPRVAAVADGELSEAEVQIARELGETLRSFRKELKEAEETQGSLQRRNAHHPHDDGERRPEHDVLHLNVLPLAHESVDLGGVQNFGLA